MSLYNMLFGVNPFSSVLLEVLGTDRENVPRFRDCYLSDDGSEIVIHTRTGGGNRESYEKGGEYWEEGQIDNDTLRALPGFKSDEDDDFDCTYADFRYEVPEAFRPQAELLTKLGAVSNPAERWQELLTALHDGDQTKPDVQRALKVGEKIFGQINEAMKKTG